MPGAIKSTDLARFVNFAETIRLATEQIAALRMQVAAPGRVAQSPRPQIARSSTAMRALAGVQAITVSCQCGCSHAVTHVTPSSRPSKLYHEYLRIAEAIEPLLARTGSFGSPRMLKTWPSRIRGAESASEGLGLALEIPAGAVGRGGLRTVKIEGMLGITELIERGISVAVRAAAARTLEKDLTGFGALTAVGGAYPIHRHKEEIRRAISAPWEAVKRIARLVEDRLSTIVRDRLHLTENALARSLNETIRHSNGIRAGIAGLAISIQVPGSVTPSTFAAIPALKRVEAMQSLARSDNRAGTLRQLSIIRRTAVAAGITTPAMSAPVLAGAPAGHRRAEPAYGKSVVINSSPSITIKANDAPDIERRVLDALRQHREALYDQWHREVRRRQRVEF